MKQATNSYTELLRLCHLLMIRYRIILSNATMLQTYVYNLHKNSIKYSNLTEKIYISDHFHRCASYINASEVSLEDRKKSPELDNYSLHIFYEQDIFAK